ncbi:MAG: aminopeptidase, partial [Lachnospiraceae bacterium]|nr:aminopeptidase [Lachnospiraceae bacterium]
MKEIEQILQNRAELEERYAFDMARVKTILEETETEDCAVATWGSEFSRYFQTVSGFLLSIFELYQKKKSGQFEKYTLEEWKQMNQTLYTDVTGENYRISFANPSYAKETLGEPFFHVLCSLYTELRSQIVYLFEDKLFHLIISTELFLEIYFLLEDEKTVEKEIRHAIHSYFSDYLEIFLEDRLKDTFDPARDFAVKKIMDSDFSDPSYLYQFGEYVTENEIKTAEYLNSLSEKEIYDMAFTFTDGYRRGFELYHIDLSQKHTVNIRYHLGFERMIRAVILQFEELGLKPLIYRAGVSISERNPRGKAGYFGASPNKQYEYDHRMDDVLFFDKAYADLRLQIQKSFYEQMKELLGDFAGPAVMETFGEIPFNPLDKPESLHYSEKQQKWKKEYLAESGILSNRYIPGDQTSFSIIAYPLPEIGENYSEIFKETIRVNTLEQEKYLKIQTALIDALDQGEYVTVTGRGDNRTNLTVALAPLDDPERETRFENCLADVNIPLGEVFTSPKLQGTTGILHVTRVFLNDLEYHDLTLRFEDGVVADYSCKNFASAEENKRYISENVLFHHKTLPMGEFAIGTNTTAYAMGKKYSISHLLPILIAEKTGPHFAVGDTCFSHEEDLATYNPDGKRMIAKENDFSKLRHTESSKAYFNCHTDITIPYDEL